MNSKIIEVAKVFLKLGCFAFGGPAAHISMMQDEIVKKRKWMTEQHFLDLIGATNLIPGPNSTEMTMHCGYDRAGRIGLFVAGLCFIIPAIIITGILAYFYVNYGHLPKINPFFQGIKPVVLVIILSAVIKLGKKAVKGTDLALIGLFVLVLSLIGINEITALLFVGILGGFIRYFIKQKRSANGALLLPLLIETSTIYQKPSLLIPSKIFLTFLKVGSVLYGSGYVLFAYLDAELVSKGFLSQQQLMDAIAAGQFTPGPVLSTATFIGFQLGGISGSIAATAGIFTPSFLFVLFMQPIIPKLQKSKIFRSILDCINVAAVAVMASVMVEMGKASLFDWKTLFILLISLFFTFYYKKLNAIHLILLGSLLGFLLSYI